MLFHRTDYSQISENLIAKVRNFVSDKNKEIRTEKILIGAIHTHTSFVYSRGGKIGTNALDKYLPKSTEHDDPFKDIDYMSPDEAALFLANKIAEAVLEAWKDLKSAYIANEFARAVVGINRRVCYEDGSAKMWGDTDNANFIGLEGGNDSGIELLYTFDNDKNLTGVVMNVACPSQVVEHRWFISSDYWGKVRKRPRATRTLRDCIPKNARRTARCSI